MKLPWRGWENRRLRSCCSPTAFDSAFPVDVLGRARRLRELYFPPPPALADKRLRHFAAAQFRPARRLCAAISFFILHADRKCNGPGSKLTLAQTKKAEEGRRQTPKVFAWDPQNRAQRWSAPALAAGCRAGEEVGMVGCFSRADKKRLLEVHRSPDAPRIPATIEFFGKAFPEL